MNSITLPSVIVLIVMIVAVMVPYVIGMNWLLGKLKRYLMRRWFPWIDQ